MRTPKLAIRKYSGLPARCGWVGVGMMLSGIALRVGSARRLGPHYTRTLRVSGDHTLVTTGPYAHVRHPGYAGMLAMWAGYGLAWTNTLSITASTAPMLVAYSRRIAVEETMLEQRLGAVYRHYQRTTDRIIPHVY